MFDQGRDEVLDGINRIIAKEKEKEFRRPITTWIYIGLIVIAVVMMTIGITLSATNLTRDAKLISEYNKAEKELQIKIADLTQQLEAAQNTISEQEEKIKQLEDSIIAKDEDVKAIQDSNKELDTKLKETEAENLTLSTNLQDLSEEYNKLNDSYQVLYKRDELYDKYEYALFYNSERTDLTYDMCEYGENLMLGYGLDPDLLFSIGMTESEYTENCKNPDSTATGFHQFLKGTGKWVYEELGYTDEYDHTKVQTNGYRSIECAAWYLDHLYRTRGQNIMKVIEGYRGIKNPVSYINRMNKFLSKKGKSLDDITDNTIVLFSSVNQ